jgi:hypothetical protein
VRLDRAYEPRADSASRYTPRYAAYCKLYPALREVNVSLV